MAAARILIVEDEGIVAQALALQLEALGYAITGIAVSGDEALRQAHEGTPDVVLVDINLRGHMDGVEVAETLSARQDAGIIYLTAHADDEIVRRAPVTAPFAYLIKPFEMSQLHSAIEIALYKREMERRLRQSEATTRALLDAAPDAALLLAPDGTIVALNEPAAHSLGQPAAALIGTRIQDCLPAEVVARRQGWLDQVARSARPLHAEDERDGRDVEHHVYPVLNQAGQVARLALYARDITERRRAGQALKDCEARYRRLSEQAPAGIVMSAGDRVLPAGPREAEWLGVAHPDEVRGRAEQVVQHRLALEHFTAALATRLLNVSAAEFEHALHDSLRSVAAFVHADRAFVNLYDADGRSISRVYSWRQEGLTDFDARLTDIRLDRFPWAATRLARREIVHVPRVSELPDEAAAERALWTEMGLQSMIEVPLVRAGVTRGFFGFASQAEERTWLQGDLDLLQLVGEVYAAALARMEAEQALQRRARHLAALNAAGHAVSSSLQLKEVLDVVTTQARRLLDAEGVSVLLSEPATGTLVFAAVDSAGGNALLGRRLPVDAGFAGWVMQHGEAALVADAAQDERFYAEIDRGTGLTTRTLVAVPLIVKGRRAGVLEAINKCEGRFSTQDLEMLEGLAGSASVAIDNARLYEAEREHLRQLRESQEQVIHAAKMAALGRLAASLAHEINNPLQAIQSSLELVLDFPLDEADRQQYLRIVRHEIERLMKLTNRALEFARPLQLQRQPVAVSEIVHYAMALAGKQLEHSQVVTHLEFPEEPLMVVAARDRMAQVFINLIINAIEAMPGGGELRLSARPAGEQVEIVFADNGPGIPPQVLSSIFEPYFTTKPEGTGLGLAVSHNIIDQHGGTISAANGPNGGALFTILLPAAAPA